MSKYGYLELFQRVVRLRDNESRLYSNMAGIAKAGPTEFGCKVHGNTRKGNNCVIFLPPFSAEVNSGRKLRSKLV